MPRYELWNPTLSRAELDQRARDARLQLERVERLLTAQSAAGATRTRLLRRPRPIRLRTRRLRGYDADRQGECPPPGIARPPSLGTSAADPVMRPALPARPGGVVRPLPQAA